MFENKAKAIKLRIQNFLNEIKINPKRIHDTILLKTAPWTINQSIVKLELAKSSKTKIHPITFQDKFLKIQNNFPDHHHIYTDGSTQGMKVGCDAIFQNQKLLKYLLNESSIGSVEVTAIHLAMNIIAIHKSFKIIIYKNSKSVFLALQNKDTSTPLITKLLNKMNTLSKSTIILTWLLCHISIHGNERSDKAAKKSTLHWHILYKNPMHWSKTNY